MHIHDFPVLSDHILIWIFGMILPFISGLQSEKLNGEIIFNEETRRKLYLGNAIMLSISGISILVAWGFHARSLKSLGLSFQITYTPILLLLMTLFTLAYLSDLIIGTKKRMNRKEHEEKEWFETSSFLPETKRELPYYILLCLAAGIFEEIIYRGFMVTYFLPEKDINGLIFLLRISAPAALFSMAHYYQGGAAVVKIFLFSLLLSGIYVASGSLIPCMILHVGVDLISGLASMKKKKS